MPIPLPTLPRLEPFPRSRADRLSEARLPVFRALWHYARQLVPTPMFICKWGAIGAFGVAALTSLSILIVDSSMSGDNDRAKALRKERQAEIDRKARIEKKAQELKAWQAAIADRAKANWEVWRASYTTPETGIACYHGFNQDTNIYTVSCYVGPKGQTPTQLMECTQDICKVLTVVPGSTAPPPPPKKEEKKE